VPHTGSTLTAPPGLDVDGLKRQHARHSRLGITRHCAACNAYWPCAYRTAARNKLRAVGVHVAGVL
jgi:hypothetical protein